MRQHERVARLAQELDEVGVVAWRYVGEPRVRSVDVRSDGRLEQNSERGPFVRQAFHYAASGRSATAAAAATVIPVMVMMVVMMMVMVVFACRQRKIYRRLRFIVREYTKRNYVIFTMYLYKSRRI